MTTLLKPLAEKEATRLLVELLGLPGASGGEAAVVEYLRSQLVGGGFDEKLLQSDTAYKQSTWPGEVGNFALRLPGTTRGPRRMLVAHMDTVPICQGAQPVLKGRRITKRDKHTGLGGDNRAGVAVLLSTALALLKHDLPHPPLTFLWTVQEEAGLHGARHVRLAMLGKPRLAFNFDGSLPERLTLGATGGYRMKIEIRGLASHAGGHPEQGISAIAIASLAIADLVENSWHGLIDKKGRLGTSNVGVIQGGAATNVVTDRVELRAEARSHDPVFRKQIVAEIEKAFQQAARRVKNSAGRCGEVSIEGRLDYESLRLPQDDPSVAVAAEAIVAEGLVPDYTIANGGLDANWLTARGIPTVSLGCGQNNIHTAEEWLDLNAFHKARRIALRLATA